MFEDNKAINNPFPYATFASDQHVHPINHVKTTLVNNSSTPIFPHQEKPDANQAYASESYDQEEKKEPEMYQNNDTELCLLDSGCDVTTAHQEKYFSEKSPTKVVKMVATATGEMNKISEEGTIELANSNLPPIKDVSFTPFFKRTLLSARQANKQWKSTIIMDYDSVRVFKGKIPDRQIQNKKMGDGIMIGNMYYFPMKIQNTNFAINQRSKMNQVDGNQPIARTDQHPLETIIEAKDPTLPPKPILMQRKIGPKQKQYKKERRDMMRRERHSLPYWHARLGHLSGLRRTISLGAVHGLVDNRQPCWACIQSKQQKESHPTVIAPQKQEISEMLHVDINFKSVRSLQGNIMTMTIVENETRNNFPCNMKRKSEAGSNLQVVILFIQKQYGWNVQVIHCDRAPEFIQPGSEMYQVCTELNILIETSTTYTPEENGVAEVTNKKMERTASALLFHGNMPPSFWEYAEYLATVLHSYIVQYPKKISGYEMMTKHKPSMSRIRTFGCHVFAFIRKEERKKFAPKSWLAIYLSPDPSSVGYLLWDPQKNKTFNSSSCLFDEYSTGIQSLKDRYIQQGSKRPRIKDVKSEDEDMEDFSDMDANFKPKSDQIPVFEYERKMEQTNHDLEIHTNIIKNPPAAISTIPIPNPQPAEELSSSSSPSPPPIPSDQASPDDITTTNPIQEPKEKEKQEEDKPHQQVTNVPSPPDKLPIHWESSFFVLY